MTIERGDFNAITNEDLDELVTAQVQEGIRLEYKRELYGNSDSDKQEMLKDVSSFANTHGGTLIIGVVESGGIATEIPGVACKDMDAEILRMEQIIRSGILPSISGIRIRTTPREKDKCAFIIRIPRSWHPPHQVAAKGLNRFYMRNSAGVYQPSIEELRALFTQSTTALEQAHRFRDERLSLVCAGEGDSPLMGNGRFFLHIVPTAAFSGMVNIDIEAVHDQQYNFRPFGTSGYSPRYN